MVGLRWHRDLLCFLRSFKADLTVFWALVNGGFVAAGEWPSWPLCLWSLSVLASLSPVTVIIWVLIFWMASRSCYCYGHPAVTASDYRAAVPWWRWYGTTVRWILRDSQLELVFTAGQWFTAGVGCSLHSYRVTLWWETAKVFTTGGVVSVCEKILELTSGSFLGWSESWSNCTSCTVAPPTHKPITN